MREERDLRKEHKRKLRVCILTGRVDHRRTKKLNTLITTTRPSTFSSKSSNGEGSLLGIMMKGIHRDPPLHKTVTSDVQLPLTNQRLYDRQRSRS